MKSGVASSVWPPLQSARLLDQVRERIRYLHYSLRTEESYLHWIRAYIRFHDRRHPRDLGGEHVEAFLCWLTNERDVVVSVQHSSHSSVVTQGQCPVACSTGDLANTGSTVAMRWLY